MHALSKQQGFTLIEGLISILLTCIGLLGSAYMQVYANTSTAQVNFRLLATMSANDMLSRIMVDKNNLACYVVNSTAPTTINGIAVPACPNGSTATTFVTAWKASLAKMPSSGITTPVTVSIDNKGNIDILIQWNLSRDNSTAMFGIPHKYELQAKIS